jgi:hypothetical protein
MQKDTRRLQVESAANLQVEADILVGVEDAVCAGHVDGLSDEDGDV